MSYDLDLRSPMYIKGERFYKKRPLHKVLLIILIFSPLFFYYGLNHSHQLLANQALSLENEVNMLRQEAEPLMTMIRELEDMEMRKQIIDQQIHVQKKWPAALDLLHQATPAQITINRIEIAPGGTIKIDGTSTNMHAPASYRQGLSSLPVFGQTELNIMNLSSDQNYTFNITAQLSMGDELDGKTEEISIQ